MKGVANLLRRYEQRRRFWRHVEVAGPDDCWPWHGPVGVDGVGRFAGRRADELAFELARGRPAPGGSHRRSCRDPRCVNPEHLAEGRFVRHPPGQHAV